MVELNNSGMVLLSIIESILLLIVSFIFIPRELGRMIMGWLYVSLVCGGFNGMVTENGMFNKWCKEYNKIYKE